jgi:type I restriction enzyme S subunit
MDMRLRLYFEDFGQLRMPFPPIEDQRQIISFLDHETSKIDSLVAEQRRLIELLKEKRQAVISHAVTKGLNPHAPMKPSGIEWLGDVPEHWRVTKVKYATVMTADCPHETPEYSDEGEYLVIRTADVENGRLVDGAMYRVAKAEYHHRIRRSSLEMSDIVYTREGERWGLAARIPVSGRYCLGQRMFQLRAADHFSPDFLMWHLCANCVYGQAEVDTVGATAPHVNLSTIRNFVLASPPREEQQVIAAFVGTETAMLDSLTTEAERAIELLQERRTALISAAVTGKIDVRNLVEAN